MNINITPFYCYVKREHLFGYNEKSEGFEYVLVFGARSVPARAMLFHIMTEGGAQRANVPISALVHKKDAANISLDYLQLWDCFGKEINVVVFDYLVNKRCQIVLKDKTINWGTYMMTFDWENNVYSDTPQDYKNAHLIKLDNGCFALQPNNRIFWRDSNFITKPINISDVPKYKVDNKVFVCEVSDRWTSQDTDCFYYEVMEENEFQKVDDRTT
jgi:hypothetical protein